MRSCKDCRYLLGELCVAPQLVDLARLVAGEPQPGASVNAFLLRLNQAACGTPGYWFAENPPPPPETKELPA